ncbi:MULTISPECIES: hypothetical protein [Novosphingobium]|uniref:hypothetical protein n=1 Tax=Novosphingobium TaxID=165696 RepID=UPI001CD5BE0D|nr:hypothetical protein [Novosphingobium percolationis]MCH7629002.1 hypothetical protein [Pseudomonadota bacterium]
MAEATPLHEARALLRTFAHSKARALDVRTDRLSLFLSRDATVRYAAQPAAVAPPAAVGPANDLAAPHLGTLADVAAVGKRVSAGQAVATLRVLDRETLIMAESDGEVVTHHHALGALIEFGQPVVALAAVAG